MPSTEQQSEHSTRAPGHPSAEGQTSPRGRRHSDRALPQNLTAEVNRLVGRSEEIDRVTELLDASRLVTLTGPPGIGKTRLALEVGRTLVARYPDGASIVDLASVTDGDPVPRAVASTLAVIEVAGQAITDTLVAHLQGRRFLLILDNCEHVVASCAQMADALLRGCPYITILATSREPLTTAGERIWQVPPLSVPDDAHASDPEVAQGYGAVELFIERARGVQAGFVLDADVAPVVATICRRLDGIPLAIELAAARVETLSPADIAGRLDDRFSLLTSGSRSVLPRHQTLLAAVDWSHNLLSALERALLRRLSVFVGGFELGAVEAVCVGGELEARQGFDLVSRLVAKSLVVADTNNSAYARYRLLETIRAYASDRLEEAGEAGELLTAHAGFYLALGEQAEPELTGAHQQRWLERLEAEHGNLRSAIERSLGAGDRDGALRLAAALVLFWRVHGHFRAGRELLDAVVSASDGPADEPRAKALWGAGFMALMVGDFDAAVPSLEKSLRYFREQDNRQGCARALLLLGNCGQFRSDPDTLALLEESVTLAREAGDQWCLSHSLGVAGLEQARRDLGAAGPLFEECLSVARAAQDPQGLRLGLFGLGSVVLRQGDYRLAESLLEEAMTVTRDLGEDYSTATALRYLGDLALRRGNYGRARELLDAARGLVPAGGGAAIVRDSLMLLARVARAEGNSGDARVHFEEAQALASNGTVIAALTGLGELAAEQGDLGEGRRLLDTARDLAQARGWEYADATYSLAQLARDAGEAESAGAMHHEVLQIRRQISDAPGMVASLEAVAGLAAVAGRHEHAARLLGAAQALRDRNGYVRPPWEAPRYQDDVALLRQTLTADQFENAWTQGEGLSIEEATLQACKGRGQRTRPASGWASLTETQQQVATLMAEGLTNPEIAERLFMSLGAVKAHLSRIYTRLGISGRRDLVREIQRGERSLFKASQSPEDGAPGR